MYVCTSIFYAQIVRISLCIFSIIIALFYTNLQYICIHTHSHNTSKLIDR